MTFARLVLAAALAPAALPAAAIQKAELQSAFDALGRGFNGLIGLCAQDRSGAVCLNADQPFPMQSVMKLLVAAAVMDAADNRGLRLDEPVIVRKEDLSVFVQPIAALVTANGYRTTIGDLVRRAVVDSDSAAADILIRRLGGTRQVQAFLDRKAIAGIRIDRDERTLQTDIVGLAWRPEFVDAAALDRAIAAVPDERRTACYRQYQADPRDTATPKGMAGFLFAIAEGKLLSVASTAHLLQVMTATVTSPDRLKAGVPAGWALAHKTGTSSTWKGVTAATNDVGVLASPAGGRIAIAAFVADSREPAPVRARIIARAAALTAAGYR